MSGKQHSVAGSVKGEARLSPLQIINIKTRAKFGAGSRGASLETDPLLNFLRMITSSG